ncbi:hypothetical protein SNARM312S_07400 [Streptomyces narbonensis]
MYWSTLKLVMTKGPLPTIGNCWSLLNFEKSPTFSQTCFGTIGTSSAVIVACGFLSSMTSVRGSVAVTFLKLAVKLPFAVAAFGSVIILLKVQAASSAVAGFPSDHFESSRIVYVHVSLSAEGVHAVARPGIVRASLAS